MNAVFAFCGLVVAGWITPESAEPISPMPEKSPAKPAWQQKTNPQSTAPRPARATNEGTMRGQKMPVPPTDPRTYANSDLPLPPTMNDSGMLRSVGPAGMGPRQDTVDNGVRSCNGPKGLRPLQAGAGRQSLHLAQRRHQQRHGQPLHRLRPAGTGATTGPSRTGSGGELGRSTRPGLPAGLSELRLVLSRQRRRAVARITPTRSAPPTRPLACGPSSRVSAGRASRGP